MKKKFEFGFGQMRKATPAFIARTKRALNFLSGGLLLYLSFIASKIGIPSEDLEKYLGMFVLAFNFVGLMFGVPVDPGEMVPAEKVTEMETK